MVTVTYNNLVTLIINTSENDGTDFVATVPDFIDTAERRLTKDMDSYGMVQITSATLSVGNPFVSIPGSMQVNKSLTVTQDNGTRLNLVLKTNEYINQYWPVRTSTGTPPKYYGRFGAYQWIVAPTPASALGLEIEMVARPTAISSAVQTNWFTDFAAEALFYAAMCEATMFMKAYDAAAVWETKYQQQIAMLRNEARRTRRDDQEVPLNVDGGENNLLPGER